MENKTVLIFGIFDEEYSRNRVLIKGLQENGCEVVRCRIDPKKYSVFGKYWALFKKSKKYSKQDFDHVLVAFPGHSVVWIAYLLFGRKVIFDAFVSLYNSEIEDRRLHRRLSFRAFYYWTLDWYSLHLVGIILIDTVAHRDFIAKKFSIPLDKFVVVYVGSDDDVVHPHEILKNKDTFLVHFHGTGIPLQGIDYIIDAAYQLKEEKDIQFILYGNVEKVLYEKMVQKAQELDLDNIEFKKVFPYEDMSSVLAQADVCLGIFGNTAKSDIVIPNKVYEGWATKKPVITSKNKAIQEVAEDGREVYLCNPSDGSDLARAILRLKNDTILSAHIAESGYNLYKRQFTPKAVVERLLQELQDKDL